MWDVHTVALTKDQFEVEISITPSLVSIGDGLNMSCIAVGPDRLAAETLLMVWSLDEAGMLPVIGEHITETNISSYASTYLKSLLFDTSTTSDARSYFCSVLLPDLGIAIVTEGLLLLSSKELVSTIW